MIIKVLIGAIVLIAIYFYTFHMNKSDNIAEPMKNKNKDFLPSDKFAGAKEGYVFKMDSKGLGYYLDRNNH